MTIINMKKNALVPKVMLALVATGVAVVLLSKDGKHRQDSLTDVVVGGEWGVDRSASGSLGNRFVRLDKGASKDQSFEGVLAFDEDDLREVAGFFDDVFVGKVVKIIRTEIVQGLVLTHYEVEVVDPLKGNLRGIVQVTQQGGVVDGIWAFYIPKETQGVAGDTEVFDHKNLLNFGQVYLFTTISNDKLKTNLLGPTRVSFQSLDVDESMGGELLQTEASVTSEVRDMKNAIANQTETRRR